jgi:hypothetical protein
VLFDTRRDREDVRIEDDVLGREADPLGEQPIRPRGDRHLAIRAVRLSLLVERHHHHRGAVAAHQSGVLQELGLTLLEADRVDHALPLDALEPRLDHRPLRRVDHHGHAADVGLGRDEPEERRHGALGVEHPLVHVDVDQLGAALHLLARDV